MATILIDKQSDKNTIDSKILTFGYVTSQKNLVEKTKNRRFRNEKNIESSYPDG